MTPHNHRTPEMNGIHVEAFQKQNALRLTATDFEMSIRVSLYADVKVGGQVVINPKLLIDILNKLPGDEVSFELKHNNLLYITSGVTSFNLAVLDGVKYPRVEMPMPGSTVAVSGISSLIASTIFAVSKEPIGEAKNKQLCCVNLTLSADGIRAAASDGRCIVETHGDRECDGNFSMLISATAATTLASLANDSDVFAIGVTGEGSGKTASFYDGSLLFTARLLNADFINVGGMFDGISAATTLEVDAQKLREMVTGATAVAEKNDQLELSVGNGKLTLSCTTQHGKTEASIDVPSVTDPSVMFYFSLKQFSDCVKTLKGAATMELSKAGVLILRCGNTRYLQINQQKRVLIPKVEKAPKPKAEKKTKTVKPEKPKKAA